MNDRVVITGYGCLTATGETAQSTWEGIKNAHTGIGKITLWDSTKWPYSMGGQLKSFNPRKMVTDRKLIKLLSRHDIIGLNAVDQALNHSKLLQYRDGLSDQVAQETFNNRVGVYAGSPGQKFQQQYDFMPLLAHSQGDLKQFGKALSEKVHPMWLLRILPNNVLAYTGIQYHFKGSNQNITNHAVSGLQAIIEAYAAIKAGLIDRAVAVGYDSSLEPQGVYYFGHMGLLSDNAVRSYDKDRDGTILGEGAGAIILESLSSALTRGAQIYGEVLSGASTNEANSLFSISEDGRGLSQAIVAVLKKTKLKACDIGMVVGHGNANIKSDASEAQAIGQQLGSRVPVTGFKWSIGHTIAAAGVIETIMGLCAVNDKRVPGIATLKQKAHDCAMINVNAEAVEPLSSIALVVARGFAGTNTCLLIKGSTCLS